MSSTRARIIRQDPSGTGGDETATLVEKLHRLKLDRVGVLRAVDQTALEGPGDMATLGPSSAGPSGWALPVP